MSVQPNKLKARCAADKVDFPASQYTKPEVTGKSVHKTIAFVRACGRMGLEPTIRRARRYASAIEAGMEPVL